MGYMTIWNMIEATSMIPLVSNRLFIGMNFIFKFLGVEAFVKVGKLGGMISLVRKALDYHFTQLAKDIEASGGPYICGTQYTLADVSMVPILERMEYARWWTDSLKAKHPIILKYWEEIQKREGYMLANLKKPCIINLLRVEPLLINGNESINGSMTFMKNKF